MKLQTMYHETIGIVGEIAGLDFVTGQVFLWGRDDEQAITDTLCAELKRWLIMNGKGGVDITLNSHGWFVEKPLVSGIIATGGTELDAMLGCAKLLKERRDT